MRDLGVPQERVSGIIDSLQVPLARSTSVRRLRLCGLYRRVVRERKEAPELIGFQSSAPGMNTINHLGTFDVENYGDLLYPLIFRQLLKKRDASLTVQPFSLLPGPAPQEAAFENRSVMTMFDTERAERCTVVVGGGDILRTDWDLVARHYGRNSLLTYRSLRRSIGLSGLLGYVARKTIPRIEAGDFFSDRFRSRWMSYPAPGPFLIDPANLPRGGAVAYLSCGVPHEFTPHERDRVRHTFDRSRFIYLRDESSAEKLRRAGFAGQIKVAPDVTVTLSDQFSHENEVCRGREILSRIGVSRNRPVLCFQSQPYPGFREEEIIRQLNLYRQRTDAEVILLPTGFCHGDHEFLQNLSKQSGGALKYADVYAVSDIISVIAASDIFIGTSLHGNITAFSFGIPHLLGPLPVDKAEGFLNVVNLPGQLKLRSWNEINEKIDMVTELGHAFFLERAREAKSRVYRAVDDLLEQLLK